MTFVLSCISIILVISMVETDKAYIAHCGLGFTYIVPHCVTLFFLQIRINVRDLFITIRFLGITSIEKKG